MYRKSYEPARAFRDLWARAGSYDFLFIIYSTKLLHRATLHALRTTKNTSMGSKMLTCFI